MSAAPVVVRGWCSRCGGPILATQTCETTIALSHFTGEMVERKRHWLAKDCGPKPVSAWNEEEESK